jgi:HSP20 family protein
MSMIRRASPFGELLSLRQAMDRLFEDSFVRPRESQQPEGGFAMPLDVYATPDALVVEAALPGVKPDDVEISLLGDTLTIAATSGSEQRTEEGGYLYQEVRRGRFSRTVTLPSNLKADSTTATYEHGMLRLSIPKAEAAKPRQIRISQTTDATAVAPASGNGNGASSGKVDQSAPEATAARNG